MPTIDRQKNVTQFRRQKNFKEQQKANFIGVKANKIGVFNNNYIHIRQIEVYDINGNNVALNKPLHNQAHMELDVNNVTRNNNSLLILIIGLVRK